MTTQKNKTKEEPSEWSFGDWVMGVVFIILVLITIGGVAVQLWRGWFG